MGKPSTGIGHYLRDIVGGANDGVITTMAIVAGVEGAALPKTVAIVLGLANLVADGLSMGASSYLALRSELDQLGIPSSVERPMRHGMATLVAFVIAGALPLAAFAFVSDPLRLLVAGFVAAVTLAFVGGARARFVRRGVFVCAAEMLVIGGLAGLAAWGIGVAAHYASR